MISIIFRKEDSSNIPRLNLKKQTIIIFSRVQENDGYSILGRYSEGDE